MLYCDDLVFVSVFLYLFFFSFLQLNTKRITKIIKNHDCYIIWFLQLDLEQYFLLGITLVIQWTNTNKKIDDQVKKWLKRIHVDVVNEHLNMIKVMSNMMVPSSVAHPGSGAFLTLGSWMCKKSRTRVRDEHPGSYFRELGNNFLD